MRWFAVRRNPPGSRKMLQREGPLVGYLAKEHCCARWSKKQKVGLKQVCVKMGGPLQLPFVLSPLNPPENGTLNKNISP